MDLQERHKYQRKQRLLDCRTIMTQRWRLARICSNCVFVFLCVQSRWRGCAMRRAETLPKKKQRVPNAFVPFIPQQFKSLGSTYVSIPHTNPSWSHDYRILSVLERALQLLPGLNRAFDTAIQAALVWRFFFCSEIPLKLRSSSQGRKPKLSAFVLGGFVDSSP